MTTFIIRRLLISIPVFIGITILVFTFIALAPGNLADALIRPELGIDPAARAGDHRSATASTSRSRSATSAGSRTPLQGDLGYRAHERRRRSAQRSLRGLINSLILTGTALVLGHPDRDPARRSCRRSASTRSSTSC